MVSSYKLLITSSPARMPYRKIMSAIHKKFNSQVANLVTSNTWVGVIERELQELSLLSLHQLRYSMCRPEQPTISFIIKGDLRLKIERVSVP